MPISFEDFVNTASESLTFGDNPYYTVPGHLSKKNRTKAIRAISRFMHNRRRGNQRKAMKWFRSFTRVGVEFSIMDETHTTFARPNN